MNTPVLGNVSDAGLEERAKLIKGIGWAGLILGLLGTIASLIYGRLAERYSFPANASFWQSLTSPPALKTLHIIWLLYLGSWLLIVHGIMCRRLERPVRPLGFAVGTLLSLKCAILVIYFCFIRSVTDSVNITVNGDTVNFGSRFGVFLDVIVGVAAILALLSAGYAAFFASQGTKRSLEASDPARYTLESIPLPIFLGVVLFVCLGYEYLAELLHPSLTLAGANISMPLQEVALLVFAAVCALAAWAFYTLRPWGWYVGLLVGVAWGLSSYYPPDNLSMLSRPEFDLYREFITQITPAFQKYIQFDDIFLAITLVAFIGYLIYVRRRLAEMKPAPRPSKPSASEVSIYSDRRLSKFNRAWLAFGALGVMQWVQHDYLIGLIFVGLGVLIMVPALLSMAKPRCVFREDGLALTGTSLLMTAVFPYDSFNSVRLITTPKPPRVMHNIEDGVLNFNVSMLADDQRSRLEDEFRKRNKAVTVLASAEAASQQKMESK